MAEDHGASEARKLPRAWNRNRIETEIRHRVASERVPQRFRSWTMQNEMRGVLGRCPQALQEGF